MLPLESQDNQPFALSSRSLLAGTVNFGKLALCNFLTGPCRNSGCLSLSFSSMKTLSHHPSLFLQRKFLFFLSFCILFFLSFCQNSILSPNLSLNISLIPCVYVLFSFYVSLYLYVTHTHMNTHTCTPTLTHTHTHTHTPIHTHTHEHIK